MINLLSYNSSFLQGRNVRLAHAKLLLEHFVCVLAQHRWHGADRRLGFGEFDRSVDHFYRATEVMFHPSPTFAEYPALMRTFAAEAFLSRQGFDASHAAVIKKRFLIGKASRAAS